MNVTGEEGISELLEAGASPVLTQRSDTNNRGPRGGLRLSGIPLISAEEVGLQKCRTVIRRSNTGAVGCYCSRGLGEEVKRDGRALIAMMRRRAQLSISTK